MVEGGKGGREALVGVGRTFRGASLRGSTIFRYVVKTSGSSRGDLNGRSRLFLLLIFSTIKDPALPFVK